MKASLSLRLHCKYWQTCGGTNANSILVQLIIDYSHMKSEWQITEYPLVRLPGPVECVMPWFGGWFSVMTFDFLKWHAVYHAVLEHVVQHCSSNAIQKTKSENNSERSDSPVGRYTLSLKDEKGLIFFLFKNNLRAFPLSPVKV